MMKNILEYFEKTVKLFPERIAFKDSERKVSFYEMWLSARRIGSFLSKYGMRRPVIIFADKSIKTAEMIIGTLYSGNFYLIIDINMPLDRIKSIVSLLDNPIAFADVSVNFLAEAFDIDTIYYDTAIDSKIDDDILDDIRHKMIDCDIAYLLFTSGSTGVPKGTVISHRSLISYISWVTQEFKFDSSTVFGSQTPLYFSMSVTDFYSSLVCGCTYVIIPKLLFSFPVKLIEFLNDNNINTIYWVPTALSIVANWKTFDAIKPLYLTKVLFAGEVMPSKQMNYWRKNIPGAEYANLFGPTETTDICTFYRVDREIGNDESIPIGKACDNCDVYVINENNRLAKIGEVGELYVRSSFIADGYYNDFDNTKKAFVQNPLNKLYPEIVYRTGDLVRYNELGELMYVSRKDLQIKRFGYRIETGEIEAAANSISTVKNCACVYDKNSDYLVLVYEGSEKDTLVVMDVVMSKVPHYMQPDDIMRIKKMPLNANGKIDRKILLKQVLEMKG